MTGTEEGDTIPALVKLGFSTGLAPQDVVEGEGALEPDRSLVSERPPLSLLVHKIMLVTLT